MALTPPPMVQPSPPAPARAVGGTLYSRVMHQLQAEYGRFMPAQPDADIPTLVGSPDNLDVNTATRLHTAASRWAEYFQSEVAKCEASALLLKHEVDKFTRLTRFSFGKDVDKWPEASMLELTSKEDALVESQAKLLMLKGVADGIEKVRNGASRAITRHTKVDTTEGRSRH